MNEDQNDNVQDGDHDDGVNVGEGENDDEVNDILDISIGEGKMMMRCIIEFETDVGEMHDVI